jgi:hypothetical protein
VEKVEHPAGIDQSIVVFSSEDTGSQVEPDEIFSAIAADAVERDLAGLRIVSITFLPLRQTGTAGNVFFQSGGQFATKAAVAVVYARASRMAEG